MDEGEVKKFKEDNAAMVSLILQEQKDEMMAQFNDRIAALQTQILNQSLVMSQLQKSLESANGAEHSSSSDGSDAKRKKPDKATNSTTNMVTLSVGPITNDKNKNTNSERMEDDSGSNSNPTFANITARAPFGRINQPSTSTNQTSSTNSAGKKVSPI